MAVDAKVEIDAQYRALREGAGFLERAGRGQLVVEGPEAAPYLQAQVTNDVEALAPGQGCYAALLDAKGHMRADLRVLRVGAGELWLDTEPIALKATLGHLDTYRIGRRVEIADATAGRAIVSAIGPGAGEAAGAPALAGEHAHAELALGGAACRAVATDLGVDLISAREDLGAVRAALAGAGAVEVEEAAAEILRVESGRPRFGCEMTTATIPEEAGLNERAVSFTKGCYIGQETVARLHYKGRPNRQLRGLRLSAPAPGGAPLRLGERQVGAIGTACVSPALGPIALAVVRREAGPGDTLAVGDGGVTAEVVELPFAA